MHGTETLATDEGEIKATKITQQMLGTSSAMWIDDHWRTLKASVNMMGMTMTMTRCQREQALADFEAPEFFMPTTIKAPKIIDRDAAERIDYVLRLTKPLGEFPTLPHTGMQTVTEQGEHVVRLTVRRVDHAPFRRVRPQKFGDDMAEYLAPNPLIDSADPAVVAMAKDARGDATQPYQIADRLREYVTRIIADKNLTIGFATASEVCRNKEGDCSEHAVLLAALGRASGLPSRVVVGIVYVPVFGGDENIFGFHMWTQFRIGDAWVDFDAAQRESVCNATHIAFSVSSLKDAGLGQIAIDLINVIGNLELAITRVEPPSAAK